MLDLNRLQEYQGITSTAQDTTNIRATDTFTHRHHQPGTVKDHDHDRLQQAMAL